MALTMNWQGELTPEHYARAVSHLVAQTMAEAEGNLLVRLEGGLVRWGARALALCAGLGLALVLALGWGPFGAFGRAAILAVPVPLILWWMLERMFGRVDRAVDRAIASFGQREVADQVRSGGVRVPLGAVRVALTERGVLVEAERVRSELDWADVLALHALGDSAYLLPGELRGPSDMERSVLLPLPPGVEGQGVVRALERATGLRATAGRG